MNAKAFEDFLIEKAEQFDAAIIASLEPRDNWVGRVRCGRFIGQPEWWECRELVRNISEGLAFEQSEVVNSDSEHTFDRFDNVFPSMRKNWIPAYAGDLGKPCDPQ